MRYLGGKTKIAKRIADAVAADLRGRYFWEPFCGGLSVSKALSAIAPGLVSDANSALITLYAAVAGGWQPPASVSLEQWREWKASPDTDPRKAFAGFGCAFGGDWNGHYARNDARNDYAAQARNSLLRDVPLIVARGCRIRCLDFLQITPSPTRLVLYLDPPYAGTTGYGGVPQFDHDLFYDRVRSWSQYTTVFVSEYSMPFGEPVLEIGHVLEASGGARKRSTVERLYRYGGE